MAFVANQDEENNLNQQGQSGALGGVGYGQSSGSSTASSATATPSKGSGGTPQFTNIQAYLNAGNPSGGSALNKTVGGAFDNEEKNFNSSYQPVYNQADQYRTTNKLGQGDVDNFLTNAGTYETAGKNTYDLSNARNMGYDENTIRSTPSLWDRSTGVQRSAAPQSYYDQARQYSNALNSNYSGPSSYDYTKSADFQNYGTGLQTDPAFHSLMNQIYTKSGPQTPGMQALQQQLDTADDSVAQERNALAKRYGDMNTNMDTQITNTNQAAQDAANQSQLNQFMRTNLQNRSNSDQSKLSNMAMDYNTRAHPQNVGGGPTTGDTFAQGVQYPVTFDAGNLRSADTTRRDFNGIQDLLGAGGNKIAQTILPYDYEGDLDRNNPVAKKPPGTVKTF